MLYIILRRVQLCEHRISTWVGYKNPMLSQNGINTKFYFQQKQRKALKCQSLVKHDTRLLFSVKYVVSYGV